MFGFLLRGLRCACLIRLVEARKVVVAHEEIDVDTVECLYTKRDTLILYPYASFDRFYGILVSCQKYPLITTGRPGNAGRSAEF